MLAVLWCGLVKQELVLSLDLTLSRKTSTQESTYELYVTMWYRETFPGITAHTSNVTLQYLRGQFPRRVMSKRGDWLWPPRSGGYLKQQIWDVPHNQQPQTLRALRAAIAQACNNLQQMIRNAFDGMLTRARRCINSGGYVFENQ